MNTDNIYRSVLVETGEEVLVYKTIFDEYKDFKSTRKFKLEELTRMISMSKILGFKTGVSKQNAINIYHDAKHESISANKVYIGNLAIVKEIVQRDGYLKCQFETIAYNKKFIRDRGQYIDTEDYERYSDNDMTVGSIIVTNACSLGDIAKEQLLGELTPKQKVIKIGERKFSQIS